MAKSLQEQLLGAGIASKKQVNKAKADKRKTKKSGSDDAERQARAVQLEAEKRAKQERDQQLNQQLERERHERALLAQAKQLIEDHRVPVPESADVAYNFSHGKQVKKLYVTAEQQNQLARGQLAIACMADKYWLIPGPTADKIAERQPEWIIKKDYADKLAEEEALYADYQIPDDLMW